MCQREYGAHVLTLEKKQPSANNVKQTARFNIDITLI